MAYRTVLFDFDGTLADIIPHLSKILKMLETKCSVPTLSQMQVEDIRGKTLLQLISEFRIPVWKVPTIAQTIKQIQKKEMAHIQPVPGIPELVTSLHTDGYTLGILTSNTEDNVRAFLRYHKINQFSFVIADSHIAGKGHALQRIIQENHFHRSEVIYIGDEVRDIEACLQIPIDIISVTWGLNNRTLLEKHAPRYLVDSPEEIREVIRSKN